MRILFVSAEVSPLAKVGGLADVASSLPRELVRLGHDVRVVMPCYGMIETEHALKLQPVGGEFSIGTGRLWERTAHLSELKMGEVCVWLISGHERFASAMSSADVYQEGFEQYVFFCKAVLEACKRADWIPDVVHSNDWHTALIPALMRETSDATWDKVGAVFTVHNLAYQGVFGREVLDYAGLPQELWTWDKLETFGQFNFLKSGCVYAERVNTVSPRYAEEVLTEEYGCTLWGLLRHLKDQGKFSGILNGIDAAEFDPASDPVIAAHFDADHPENKIACKEALLRELGMEPIAGAPLACAVSRLSEQKGMELILALAKDLEKLPVQLFVQGVGDPWLADQFDRAVEAHPRHVRFAQRFDVALGQRAYAGGDLFLMPSAFEPCGLGQMIAMRYGTVPVVRKTGGLADTVKDGFNGFVFEVKSSDVLLETLARAKTAFDDPSVWSRIQQAAFRSDFRWDMSAKAYLELYGETALSRPTVIASSFQQSEPSVYYLQAGAGQ